MAESDGPGTPGLPPKWKRPDTTNREPAAPRKEKPPLELIPDPFINQDNVYSLTYCNRQQLLENNEATLVLFYDPQDDKSKFCREWFRQGANLPRLENHVFAAVDCSKEPLLCFKRNTSMTPYYKLYYKTFTLKYVKDYASYQPDNMRKLMQGIPQKENILIPKKKRRDSDD